jgi:TolB protein
LAAVHRLSLGFRWLPMTTDRTPHPTLSAALPQPLRRRLMAALISTPALPALAQFRVEVTGVG